MGCHSCCTSCHLGASTSDSRTLGSNSEGASRASSAATNASSRSRIPRPISLPKRIEAKLGKKKPGEKELLTFTAHVFITIYLDIRHVISKAIRRKIITFELFPKKYFFNLLFFQLLAQAPHPAGPAAPPPLQGRPRRPSPPRPAAAAAAAASPASARPSSCSTPAGPVGPGRP